MGGVTFPQTNPDDDSWVEAIEISHTQHQSCSGMQYRANIYDKYKGFFVAYRRSARTVSG